LVLKYNSNLNSHLAASAKLAFKFRLYPTRKQEERMMHSVEVCRQLWNVALANRKRRWELQRKSTSYKEQCKMLTSEFKAEKQLASLHSQVAQDALHRLDRAFRSFFKKERGYPRFKKFRSYGSFAYPQPYNGSAKLNERDNRIFLSKIGNVRIVVHRRVPSGRRLKTCTIILEPDGRWFASLIYDELLDIRLPFFPGKSSWNAPVGIDLGLSSLITTSDGCKIVHPKFLRRAENKMRLLQIRLSRKRRGSKNSTKARLRLATPMFQSRQQKERLQPETEYPPSGNPRFDCVRGPGGAEHAQESFLSEVHL